MNKNDAKELKNGQKVYYLGLNYLVHECEVDFIREDEEKTGVTVYFMDGTEEYFDDNNHKYMYLTRKEALEHAEYELNAMVESVKSLLTKEN